MPVAFLKLANGRPDAYAQLLNDASPRQAFVHSHDHRLLAVALRPHGLNAEHASPDSNAGHWQRGALLVEFAHPPSISELPDLVKLCQAFAEVLAARQSAELETLLDTKWLNFQKSLANLAATSTTDEAATLIVNDLAALTDAARVSIVRSARLSRPTAIAVSGVVQPQKKAANVEAIETLGKQAIRKRQPLCNHQALNRTRQEENNNSAEHAQPANGFENYVCIPLITASSDGQSTAIDTAVLFEWPSYEAFLSGCTTSIICSPHLSPVGSNISGGCVPRSLRKLSERASKNTLSLDINLYTLGCGSWRCSSQRLGSLLANDPQDRGPGNAATGRTTRHFCSLGRRDRRHLGGRRSTSHARTTAR
ncbi:MAG: hypothetical protein R3C53_20090 [Pirellulaceae bacterium]